MADPLGVDLPAALGVLLGAVDLSKGGRIDHRGGLLVQQTRYDAIAIGQVELWPVQRLRLFAQRAAQLATQLPAGTRDGDSYGTPKL